jgi:hypothetical protein
LLIVKNTHMPHLVIFRLWDNIRNILLKATDVLR